MWRLRLGQRALGRQGVCLIVEVARPSIRLGAALAMSATLAQAQELPELDETIALAEVSCRELMGQGGDDRERSISFLHGFVLGAAQLSEFTIGQIIDVEIAFLDRCLNNPTASALATMRAAHELSND